MDKTAWLTGAAAGFGRACSLRFAREHTAVGVLDLEDCRRVVADIEVT